MSNPISSSSKLSLNSMELPDISPDIALGLGKRDKLGI
jgi:hypothetical protein